MSTAALAILRFAWCCVAEALASFLSTAVKFFFAAAPPWKRAEPKKTTVS